MKIVVIFFIVILVFGCKERQVQIGGVPVEHIDFFSLTQKDINDIPNEYFSDIKYVNIQPDSNLLFSEIHKIEIQDSCIYIMDSFQKLLGIFDMSGHGIGKVGDIGRASSEYLNLSDFSIDKNGNIYLIDGRLDKMNIYDKERNFIKSVQIPFEMDVFTCLENDNFLIGLSSWNNQLNAGDKLIKVDCDLSPLMTFCEYDKNVDHSYWLSYYKFLRYRNTIIYNRFLDNNVYLFSDKGEVLKSIYFDFGNKNVPETALRDIEQHEELYGKLCCLKEFTIVQNNFLLGYVWDERTDKIFFIDRRKDILYLGKPAAFNKLGNVIGVCDGGIISCIYPGDYMEYLDQGKEINLPENVKKHLANQGVVLCVYSLNTKCLK